jgi:glutamine---fructose-6-phosphate transaminase (isomerizing)
MCVLAAYNGDEPAAPILLDMLSRIEGLGGGFYTGVATIHEGQLHWQKVVGDVAALTAQTGARDLPGTIGIAHSRTPSGGGREWGHPFIGNSGDLAYVANGAQGHYEGRTDCTAAGNALLQAGYSFRSAVPEDVGSYPRLLDGNSVHFSEIMCLAIEENLRQTWSLLDATSRAFQEWPSEIVGLSLDASSPDHFVASRINQPLVIGRSANATYAATTRIGFPAGTIWHMLMPGNTAAAVYEDHIEAQPFDVEARPVAAQPSLQRLNELVVPALQQEPQSIGGLCSLITPLWPENQLPQSAMVIYEAVAGLLEAGQVELVTERVPGMFGEGTVPRTWVKWVG